MKTHRIATLLVAAALGAGCAADATEDSRPSLLARLKAIGLDRHMGIAPAKTTVMGAYTVYEFDPKTAARCLEGTPFYVTVSKGTSANVMLYLQGGGGCWNYDSCYDAKTAQTTSSPMTTETGGIFNRAAANNPLKDYNVVFASYCDGSVWSGDADQVYNGRTTYHHGLANVSAAITLLKKEFPNPAKLVVAGSSAGGYGTLVGSLATRSQFPTTPLYVLNDAGPWLLNPDNHNMTDNAKKNWGVTQLFPPECPKCQEQMYYIAEWAMNRDAHSRWGLFSFDNDLTIGTMYLQYGGRFTQVLLDETDGMVARHPGQFSGYFLHGITHTILWNDDALTAEKDGVSLMTWIDQMVNDSPAWGDHRR
jgi:hypothetical protein